MHANRQTKSSLNFDIVAISLSPFNHTACIHQQLPNFTDALDQAESQQPAQIVFAQELLGTTKNEAGFAVPVTHQRPPPSPGGQHAGFKFPGEGQKKPKRNIQKQQGGYSVLS